MSRGQSAKAKNDLTVEKATEIAKDTARVMTKELPALGASGRKSKARTLKRRATKPHRQVKTAKRGRKSKRG